MPRALRPVPPAVRGAALPRTPARVGPAVPALLAVASLLLAGCSGSVSITAPPASDRAACDGLARQLPRRLAGLPPTDFSPADADGGAWGDPPITLTCGVDSPRGFGPASSCITVDGVDWFAPDEQTQDNSADITLTTVTLKPRVALHVPATYRGGTLAAALVDLAGPLKSALTRGARCQ